MIYVISMEFLSLSRRRSSSRNVPQRRLARRNVYRSQAMAKVGIFINVFIKLKISFFSLFIFSSFSVLKGSALYAWRRGKHELVYTLNSFGIEGLISKRKAALTRWWNVLLRLFSQYPNSAFHLIMSQTAVIKITNLKIVLKKFQNWSLKNRF